MSRERGGSTLAGAGRVCPLCSGVDKVPVIEVPPWKVSECPRCRLGFLDPPLSSEQVSALYDQTFYYDNRMVADANDAKKAVAAQRPRVRYLQRVRRSGRLLEIGAGMGYLLAAARDAGFNATGLELSPWAAGQARDVLGLQVVVGGVETAPFTPESFDMIVMWHVIEHFVDPFENLRRFRGWLRPKGVLVLETRNYTGYDARRSGSEWNGWSLPHHLWHFSPRSLRRTLAAAGFSRVRVRTDHSSLIKQRVRRLPLLSILRNPISRMASGSNVRALGWTGE